MRSNSLAILAVIALVASTSSSAQSNAPASQQAAVKSLDRSAFLSRFMAENFVLVKPAPGGVILSTFDTTILKDVSDSNISGISKALDKGFSINSRIRTGRISDLTLLHLAVDLKNADIVEVLLKRGADPNLKVSINGLDAFNGFSPLHLAAFHDSELLVRVLTKGGAKVAQAANDGRMPTHMAAMVCAPNSLKALLAAGASASTAAATPPLDGYSPLHAASELSCPQTMPSALRTSSVAAVVSSLLAGGANPNAECCKGNPVLWRPIINFAGHGELEAIKLLVAAGADFKFAVGGQTSLDFAVLRKHTDVAAYLRSLGATELKPQPKN